mgnify:FL=1
MLYYQMEINNRNIERCKIKIQQLENQLDNLYVGMKVLQCQKSQNTIKKSYLIEKKSRKKQDYFAEQKYFLQREINIIIHRIKKYTSSVKFYLENNKKLEIESIKSMDNYFEKLYQRSETKASWKEIMVA